MQTAGDTGGVSADQATDISNQAFTHPGGQSGGSTGGSNTGTGQFGTHNTGSNQNQNTGVASGQGVGSGGRSSTAGGTGTNAGSGFDGSSGNAGQKNQVFYEDDDNATGNTAQGTSNPSQKSNTTFDGRSLSLMSNHSQSVQMLAVYIAKIVRQSNCSDLKQGPVDLSPLCTPPLQLSRNVLQRQ